ncbi:hypothetical protein [Psychroflexus halocasei]|uniref:Lipoprotein n=1 Tax=Psychroflexus halocasei TaxID=908615 RepID=A0A1H4E937_9FLAO|nr:hypothetical protein [Psychroflexus halocasei]SEA80852.1 hypothetical protein SAMN05421540_1312 [Psychroflexus halocasei]
MKRTLIIVIVIFFISGCKVTSTKDAKISFALETKESLEKYLSTNNLNYEKNHLYTLKDIRTFAEFNAQDKLSLPQVLFFKKNGKQVKNVFNHNECTNIISDFNQINDLKIDESALLFKELLDKIKPLYSNKVKDDMISVVIFYGKYVSSHKSINNQSFEWYEEVSKVDKNDVNILLVSLDVMQNWNLSKETKESIGIE